MKKITTTLAFIAFTLGVFAQSFEANTETSQIKWHAEKVTGSHDGTVALESGTMEFKDGELVGGTFTVDMSTIVCTDLEGEYKQKLEGHLKSPDFFAVEEHATANFKITKVKKQGNSYLVTGDLTIKGITNSQQFEVTISEENGKKVATGDLTIDRSKYNVKYGSASFFDDLGDKMIYDDFTLSFTVKAS